MYSYSSTNEQCDQFLHSDLQSVGLGLSVETGRIVRSWKNTNTQYTLFRPNENIQHEIMGIDAYVHITSPIRRLVDLLNQMILCQATGIVTSLSGPANLFLIEWLKETEYINSTSNSIRKVQMDCELLTKCMSYPDLMDKSHDGIVIDKNKITEKLFSYMVYIEPLKMMTRVKTETDYLLHSNVLCKLYLFQEEDKVINKIRTVIL